MKAFSELTARGQALRLRPMARSALDLLDYTDPDHVDYQRLRAAFQQGYSSLLEWPEAYPGQIDTFIAARQIWRANWVARHEPAHAQRFITWMASRFLVFLDTGTFPR